MPPTHPATMHPLLTLPIAASRGGDYIFDNASLLVHGARRGFALEKTLAQHQRWVWDACFSADSAYLVTASSDHSARLWDLSSGAAIRYYSGHSLAVTCCALNDSSAA